MIIRLDHVNVLTAQLEKMVDFYTKVLELETGWRPGFDIDGAWLYCDGWPIIHLVDRPDSAQKAEGRIEHFALRGAALAPFIAHLEAASVQFEIVQIPGTNAQSVNIYDPDHNHIEVIFGELPDQSEAKGNTRKRSGD